MTAARTPRHPEIYRYDEAFVDPAVRAGDWSRAVTEVAEQIYQFRLLTPEFCRRLVEEADHHGGWITEESVEPNPFAPDVDDPSLPDTTLPLSTLPGLDQMYHAIVDRHLAPLIGHLWPIFTIKKRGAPYLLKYEPEGIRSMGLHYDLETVSLVCYLNEEYEGGGTHFPRWGYHTGRLPTGSAILYPGGLSHVHEAQAISAGRRYLLLGCFY